MADDDPLTDAERAFRKLQTQRGAFSRWAAEARADWAARRNVPAPAAKSKAAPKNRQGNTLAPWAGLDEQD